MYHKILPMKREKTQAPFISENEKILDATEHQHFFSVNKTEIYHISK